MNEVVVNLMRKIVALSASVLIESAAVNKSALVN